MGLKQDIFAKLTGVSRKTLSEVENDKGNYTSDIINKVFKPFGLEVGLVPTSRHTLSALFKE
ncbi:helix-turn-helix transcriptional regulator [Rahnella inusitata]|uniref:helix-turn-helix transcriptional regulator n=1 Tax=Rahnella inusitata TaxID=58169 RepID=UPI0039AEC90D